jgi:hypothetical protein
MFGRFGTDDHLVPLAMFAKLFPIGRAGEHDQQRVGLGIGTKPNGQVDQFAEQLVEPNHASPLDWIPRWFAVPFGEALAW